MEQDSNKLPPSSIFGPAANNHVKQLAAIIDRLTYLGMNELLIPAEQISFRHSLSKCSSSEPLNNPKILGLLVEQQVESLEQRGSKGSIQRAIRVLLESALEVYDGEVKTPVRRARVMLRLLEVMYRTDEVPAFERIQEMNREIEKLLSAEVRFHLLFVAKLSNYHHFRRFLKRTQSLHHIGRNIELLHIFG